MRRKPGVAGIKRDDASKKNFKAVGQRIEATQLEHMGKQLSLFKENLEAFAMKHKHDINKNPQFRAQFQKMCAQAGVDPLASHKGFWAQMLGVGDFYYELSVQVVDVCIATRQQNGGLLSMEELLARLKTRRGRQSQEIAEDDVRHAVKKIACLGNGFQLLTVGARTMVLSVPCELNRDHTAILEQAQATAFVTISGVCRGLSWPRHRVDAVLVLMLQEGMVWIDTQTPDREPQYWFPSLFSRLFAGGSSGS